MPKVGFKTRLVENPLKGLLMGFCNLFLASMNIREVQALEELPVGVGGGRLVAMLQQETKISTILSRRRSELRDKFEV